MFAPLGRGGLHHVTIQEAPERKISKNHAHLDLFVEDAELEVSRLRRLGPTALRDSPLSDDVYRTLVLADLEGNEFCIVQLPGGWPDSAPRSPALPLYAGTFWAIGTVG